MLDENHWAFVEGGRITLVSMGLPTSWRNIHALHLLSQEELYDLTWAGHSHTSILPVIDRPPAFDSSVSCLEGPSFSLGNQVVYADYKIVPIPKVGRPKFENGIPISVLGKGSNHIAMSHSMLDRPIQNLKNIMESRP